MTGACSLCQGLDSRGKTVHTDLRMKKHARRRHVHSASRRVRRVPGHYVTVVRGWMFVVAFALMLGVGAIVGRFLNEKLSESVPQVAGVQIEAR